MKPNLGTYSLFLVVIAWGTLLGGIHYSHLAYFPGYLAGLPDSAVAAKGVFGVRDAVFWITMHPILILSLALTLWLNRSSKTRRKLILTSAAVYALVLTATHLYFLPELMAFQDSPNSNISPAEWFERGQRWQRLSWIRGAAMYAAILPLLLALTKPYGISNSLDISDFRAD